MNPWVDCVAEGVADQVVGEYGDEDGDAGGVDHVRGGAEVVVGDAEDVAPRRRRRLDAEPEPAQAGVMVALRRMT